MYGCSSVAPTWLVRVVCVREKWVVNPPLCNRFLEGPHYKTATINMTNDNLAFNLWMYVTEQKKISPTQAMLITHKLKGLGPITSSECKSIVRKSKVCRNFYFKRAGEVNITRLSKGNTFIIMRYIAILLFTLSIYHWKND